MDQYKMHLVQWYLTSFIEESRMIVNSLMHCTVFSPVETVLLDKNLKIDVRYMIQYRKGQQLFQSGFHPKLITLLIYKHNNMVILYNDMAWEVVLIFCDTVNYLWLA